MKLASNSMKSGVLALAAGVALAACGAGGAVPGSIEGTGSGGGSSGGSGSSGGGLSAGTAQGAYGGTLTGSAYGDFVLLVLEDNSFWMLYGNQGSGGLDEAGFVQGSGQSSGSNYTAANVLDFGSAPPATGSVSATYTSAPTISGTITYASAPVTFSGGTIPGSSYVYATPATLSTIAGTWSMSTLTGASLPLTISTGGTVSGTDANGCTVAGTATPRPSGKNVFNVTLTLGSACTNPGSVSGIAIATPISSGGTDLLIAAIDSAGSFGYGASGTN